MAIEKSPLESSMEDETPIEIELEQNLGEPDGSKTFLVQEDGSFLDADKYSRIIRRRGTKRNSFRINFTFRRRFRI